MVRRFEYLGGFPQDGFSSIRLHRSLLLGTLLNYCQMMIAENMALGKQ